jgi:lysophospholipase L1-like esterase
MTPSSKWLFMVCVGVVLASVVLLAHGYQANSSVEKQIGISGLLCGVLSMPLFFVGPSKRRRIFLALGGIGVWVSVFFVAGEVILRLAYPSGESFSAHGGPFVKKFEREFHLNRYDGPSRGPEIGDGSNPGSVRLLVQGDSITWGQGVRDEDSLYTTRVLADLRKRGVNAEMAVLARTGREIDSHVQQLRNSAETLRPDVVIYQWYINDIELDTSFRPSTNWIWRRTFVHRFLVQRSYLWFFLDYNAASLLSSSNAYEDYLAERYPEGSIAWNDFSEVFTQWCTLATGATPRVLVVLYPLMALPYGAPPTFSPVGRTVGGRLERLCPQARYLDLVPAFSRFEDAGDLRASRYDNHPSAAAHAVMADEISRALGQFWPDLFPRGAASTDSK